MDRDDVDLLSDQSRMGRAALAWSEADLARAAGVSMADVAALETGAEAGAEAGAKVVAALARAGVTFHRAEDGSPRMRARTLDGIIEAPVRMKAGAGQASVVKR